MFITIPFHNQQEGNSLNNQRQKDVLNYLNLDKITTGCVTISVKSDTPLIWDICWRSRLPFYVVNGHCAGFDLLKKIFEIFYFVRDRARYKLRLVFRLSSVFSKFKFMLSMGIHFSA